MMLADFKNKYQGHRAFFIGGGPSLNQTPLHLMKDEYCFGCNRIYEIYSQTDWRATHYLAVTNENWKYKEWVESLENMVATGIPCFIADKYWIMHALGIAPEWYTPPKGDNVIPIRARKLMHGKPGEMVARAGWTKDVEDFIVSHRTVSMVFLQLAHWMGFSPLYLVGCDLGYKTFKEGEPDPNHWIEDYELYKRPRRAANNNIRMQKVHVEMSKIAKKQGIEVYNATIGGELETYERVDIYELLK